ncbi:DUF4416 family protein [Desulfatirhabdium butyrativorans]|uniref:DUF4416 family protein n=1 Tax=Desulfatirhabdium butyrativorans TaxID=340467 RepID=UPI0004068F58|nr:DUF4416 family protein [Desulfatirhabdium butyrativorans]
MSEPKPPDPAKLVIGVFLRDASRFAAIFDVLIEQFGPVDILSRWFPFDFTAYYASEMGKPLFRRMMSFNGTIDPDCLAQIKLKTNEIETALQQEGRRTVNIDPGYLLRERFVLATGKNFAHRISIGKGIYADLTLIFQRGDFQTLAWTYPDYAQENVIGFLRKVRNKYIFDLKHRKIDGPASRSCASENRIPASGSIFSQQGE